MEYRFAGQDLRSSHQRGVDALQFAQGTTADILLEGAAGCSSSDHLIMATTVDGRRMLGLLAASDHASTHEPFLLLDAAHVAPHAGGAILLQRMIALVLLRMAGEDELPRVIVACTRNAAFRKCLRDFGGHFSGAAMFPRDNGNVVELAMAALARRIRRALPAPQDLLLLDFSACDEAMLLDVARRIYRRRDRGTNRPSPGFDSNRAPSQISAPRRKVAATRPAILRP